MDSSITDSNPIKNSTTTETKSTTANSHKESYPPPSYSTNAINDSYELEESESFDSEAEESRQENEALMHGLTAPRFSTEETQSGRGRVEHEITNESNSWHSKGSGLVAGVFNMSNSILGAGIVGLPYALKEAGLIGIFLIVSLGILTDWTLRLIVLNAKMSGRNSYIEIMDSCFGQPGRAAASFFQLSFAFGGMTAFCVILGDTVPHFLSWALPEAITSTGWGSFIVSRHFIIIFMTTAISFPLSLFRSMDQLSFASSVSLISMCVIVVSVVLSGPLVSSELRGTAEPVFVSTGIFEAIGVISFAFVCHHNSLLIFSSLRTPTIDRFAKITHVSTAVSVAACLVMSVAGYLTFHDLTVGNILNNFAKDSLLINVARLCLGLNMTFTTPSEALVCREVLILYFWPGSDFNKKRHFLITTGLVFSAMAISLITCDLGLVLELAGGSSATALAYIFPSICYITLSRNRKTFDWTRIAAFACCAFGIVVMVLSTVLSIMKALSEDKIQKVC